MISHRKGRFPHPVLRTAIIVVVLSMDSIMTVMLSGRYKNSVFVLYDKNGIPSLCQGGYLICDKCYLNLALFMCPFSHRFYGAKGPSISERLNWR